MLLSGEDDSLQLASFESPGAIDDFINMRDASGCALSPLDGVTVPYHR